METASQICKPLKTTTLNGQGNNPMKIIACNCKGLAKPKAVRVLKKLLKSSQPDIIFLSEVKTSYTLPISQTLSSAPLTNHFFVLHVGLAGGL